MDESAVIDLSELDALIATLRAREYRVIGPVARDGAIVYDEVASAAELPVGWTDEQDGGTYRLRPRGDEARFGYAVGPHSWKKFLFPPRSILWRAHRTDAGFEVEEPPDEAPPFAFLGVRSCELHAIAIQDKVFLETKHPDPTYAGRRERAFIVAVNCGTPAGTCFCVSMNTGPRASGGYDLALTEVLGNGSPEYVIEVGSDRGAEVLAELPRRPATAGDANAAVAVTDEAARNMGRQLDTTGIHGLLQSNPEHSRWDDVASRCLACGNCTLVCPTCFCNTVEDTTDLTGEHAERSRRWDSCYTLDFSHLGEGSVRTSTRSRYRQWLTHKVDTWFDQFGVSGCVGCGRCITWCPVGIDLTEEIPAIRAPDGRAGPEHEGGRP
ncbi:MAG TPA: 4Fe-4S dicluster domain-containing protein [Actinomycetota bacterium]|nr:4Fe-4S dicluster domain-containing protein [Actinomycetota bacterium]